MTRDLECSTFQRRPCYRYIRASDQLPTYEELGDNPTAKIRLFNPTGAGTWWLAAYDPDTRVAWGRAEIQENEYGSIGMSELVEFRGRFGLPIERDQHFKPTLLSECS